MTRDDIIRMAREAGWEMDSAWDLYDGFNSRLERFANLVAASERQECIDLVAMYGGPVILGAAIRMRGKK